VLFRSLALISRGRLVSVGEPEQVLSVEMIREHYGAEVRIVQDADGIVIVPVRAAAGVRR